MSSEWNSGNFGEMPGSNHCLLQLNDFSLKCSVNCRLVLREKVGILHDWVCKTQKEIKFRIDFRDTTTKFTVAERASWQRWFQVRWPLKDLVLPLKDVYIVVQTELFLVAGEPVSDLEESAWVTAVSCCGCGCCCSCCCSSCPVYSYSCYKHKCTNHSQEKYKTRATGMLHLDLNSSKKQGSSITIVLF